MTNSTEKLKQHTRLLNASVREMERERSKLERQEKQLLAEIKKMAKASQLNAAKIMARDLVRTRNNIRRFFEMAAQLNAISLRLQTMNSAHDMSVTMAGAAKIMQKCNKKMNLPAMQKVIMNFEKNSDMMDMKNSLITDVIDDAIGEEDDEEETDKITMQVLDEIGLSVNRTLDGMQVVPKRNTNLVDAEEKMLEARLAKLQK